MNDTCAWPDCSKAGSRAIDGQQFCADHYQPKLLALVVEGIRQGIDADGICNDVPGWRNRLGRLITKDDSVSVGGLSKAKIERRGYEFLIECGCIFFSIDRHPAGRKVVQRWRYDPQTDNLELKEERIVSAEFPIGKNGEGLCPQCRHRLTLTAGRASCTNCSFEIQHDHTLYPWD